MHWEVVLFGIRVTSLKQDLFFHVICQSLNCTTNFATFWKFTTNIFGCGIFLLFKGVLWVATMRFWGKFWESCSEFFTKRGFCFKVYKVSQILYHPFWGWRHEGKCVIYSEGSKASQKVAKECTKIYKK